MSNKIVFKSKNEIEGSIFPAPVPAATLLPEWWKQEAPFIVSEKNPHGKKFIVENGNANTSFKKCTPMLDGLTSGYILQLPADVQISQIDGQPAITWRTRMISLFELHGGTSDKVVSPAGYSRSVFKYRNTWIPQTPKGYSVLVTQPYGYHDSPFYAIPAIIDSDRSKLEIAAPVWVQKGFEGIVEKGTPMLQIIPFKRENWIMEIDGYKGNEYQIEEDKNFGANLVSNYIKNHWSKKSYK
jgi:hypothetical protein